MLRKKFTLCFFPDLHKNDEREGKKKKNLKKEYNEIKQIYEKLASKKHPHKQKWGLLVVRIGCCNLDIAIRLGTGLNLNKLI